MTVRRGAWALSLACTAVVVGAPTASAACTPPLSTVFAAYNDSRLYTMVPGGDFESGAAGWTLDRASVVADPVNALKLAPDANALRIEPGGSATSPEFCVTRDFTSGRGFYKTIGLPSRRDGLTVELLYRSSFVGLMGTLPPKSTWTLTPSMKLAAAVPGLTPGSEVMVKVRLRATGSAPWLVDDIYADPRMR